MGFVGNYVPCGLSPQTDGMPVIQKHQRPSNGGRCRCNQDQAYQYLLGDTLSLNSSHMLLLGIKYVIRLYPRFPEIQSDFKSYKSNISFILHSGHMFVKNTFLFYLDAPRAFRLNSS